MRDGAKCYMNSETYAKCGDISNVNVVIYDNSFYNIYDWFFDGDRYHPIGDFGYYIPTDYVVFENNDGKYAMRIIDD